MAHGSWLTARLVGDGELARNDRPGTRQLAQSSEVADEAENPQENNQLHGVTEAASRNDIPHQPQGGLGEADRPDRAVKVAPLMAFAFSRRLHAWKTSQGAQKPDRPGDGKVRIPVNLLQVPLPR